MMIGFAVVLLLVVAQAVYNFLVINGVNQSTEEIIEKELPVLIANEQLALTISSRIAAARGYVLSGDSDFKESFANYIEQGEQNEEIVRRVGASEQFNDLINQTVAWQEYVYEKVFGEYDKGNEDTAYNNLLASDKIARDVLAGYWDLAADREELIMDMEKESLANGKTTLIVSVSISSLVVLLGLLVAFVTASFITKPLQMVMNRMQLIASGDLSAEPLETSLQDEIGQLFKHTNEMSASTRELMEQITVVSETVTSQSEELHQSSDEVRAGSEQIATTMEELARGAGEQASTVNNLTSMMTSFSEKIDEVNTNSGNIERSSREVLTMTQKGNHLMEESTNQMGVIDGIVREAVEKVEGLDVHAQEISEIVSVIQDIASQTNLLALNAAIEAARAGEHGQGFAVVADEVRKLAEESSASVKNITDIVDSIQKESSVVSESLQNGYKEVEDGTVQIISTGKMFGSISEAITDMVNNIVLISENIVDIAVNSQEMSSSIEEVAAISEESAAGIEETTASSEQSSSIMEEITGSSKQLAGMVEELNELVHRFKL